MKQRNGAIFSFTEESTDA